MNRIFTNHLIVALIHQIQEDYPFLGNWEHRNISRHQILEKLKCGSGGKEEDYQVIDNFIYYMDQEANEFRIIFKMDYKTAFCVLLAIPTKENEKFANLQVIEDQEYIQNILKDLK